MKNGLPSAIISRLEFLEIPASGNPVCGKFDVLADWIPAFARMTRAAILRAVVNPVRFETASHFG